MKDWKSTLKKRLPAALALLAAGVIGCVVMNRFGFIGAESALWERCVFIVAGMGTALAGLAVLPLGGYGLLAAYGLVCLCAVPQLLSQILPKAYRGYYAILLILLLLGVPAFLEWKKRRRGGQKEENSVQELRSVSESAPSVFVFLPLSGHRYQIFRAHGKLLLYRCGGELTGIDPAKVQTPERLRPLGKKDLSLPADETMSVRVVLMGDECRYGSEKFILRSGSRRFRMYPDGDTSNAELKRFFQREMRKERTMPPQPAPDKKRVKTLGSVFLILSVVTALIDLPWLFLPVPYKLFAALSLLPPVVCLVLACVFPNEVSLAEAKTKERAGCLTLLVLSGMVPVIRAMLDFNFLSWKRLFVLSAIVLIALCAVLLLGTTQWRRQKSVLLLIFFLAFYSVGAVAQVNYLCAAAPTEKSAVVQEMHVSTGGKGDHTYYVTFQTSEGETLRLSVSEDYYSQVSTGDTAGVYFFEGALGIPFVSAG